MLYAQHVKENRRTLTLAKYTYEIGGRLHSAMRTIGTPLAHECRTLYFSAFAGRHTVYERGTVYWILPAVLYACVTAVLSDSICGVKGNNFMYAVSYV